MKNEKKYLSTKEVSKLLKIKEHVIRHWDSIDPKTKKLRIEGLSTRTKGGTRYFNKTNINKITNLNNLLKENGKRNYSLDLASKILSDNKPNKVSKIKENINYKYNDNIDSSYDSIKILRIRNVTKKLKNLLNE